MQYYPFDSRNNLYRSKIGAVADGEPLKLRLLLHLDAHCHEAFLRLRKDSMPEPEEILLTPAELLDNYRFYDCELTLDEGLYWYSFRYTSDFGTFFVTKTETSLGIVSENGGWWQQTVYDRNFTTPNWLCGGIIYQIFPDRFFASGNEKPDVPKDRFLRSDWRAQPEYRQNNGICSLGNDYYGGDIKGIEQKLPYLAELGVSCIYLNPIFEAHSNHRYNTADYSKIDPLLGSEEDLVSLCNNAKLYGISVILDGVFSHTGDDSRYFNRYGRYETCGAYNSTESPYFSWYKFHHFPDDYAAWWGVPSLPETNETDSNFCNYITGENGILRYWLKKGIRGWRLDVADELPDEFLDRIRAAIKAENPDAYLLGEVWEDASNKISYGSRRRFLRGKQLDSVMNYPFANAIIAFVKGGDAEKFSLLVDDILENYPPCAINLLMNHIGTHDTLRILTRLVTKDDAIGSREWQSQQSLSLEDYNYAVSLLKIAAVIQYTLPGVPSLYYGDEAGLQGFADPFCRGTFPWGNENERLTKFYKQLGSLRRSSKVFACGSYKTVLAEGGTLVFERCDGKASALIAINRNDFSVTVPLDEKYCNSQPQLSGTVCNGNLNLNSKSAAILIK